MVELPTTDGQLTFADPKSCDHAWVLNVKPNVCLWCGAKKPERKKRPREATIQLLRYGGLKIRG